MRRMLLFMVVFLLLGIAPVFAGEWGKIVSLEPASDMTLVSETASKAEVIIGAHTDQWILSVLVLIGAVLLGIIMQSVQVPLPLRMATMCVTALMITLPVATADMFTNGYRNQGVLDVGHNYVEFNWTNTVETTGKVNWGPTNALGNTGSDSSMQRNHRIKITGLDPETKYYYEIIAKNQSGGEERLGAYYIATGLPKPWEVTTTPIPDMVAPNISDISVIVPSQNSVRVTWITDEPASSIVFYDTDSSFDMTEGSTGLTSSHSVTLNDLTSGALYYYMISSCDEEGNCKNTSIKQFKVEVDNQPQFIESSLGTHHNAWAIDFTVTTKPFSTVKLYVNGEGKSVRDVDADGAVGFSRVQLDQTASPNIIKLSSTDLNLNEVVKEYALMPDFDPPIMNITQFNTTSISDQITIKGFVSELVTLDLTVHPAIDSAPPGSGTGLNATDIYSNSIELQWDDATETDFMTFILYRDGVRITNLTHTRYTDSGMDSNRTYVYQISKMDASCNEGAKSESLAVTTKEGGPSYNINATEINVTCNDFTYNTTVNISGHFSITAQLTQGINYIKLVAKDPAGSQDIYENSTYYDSGEPAFVDTNLEQFNGLSYERDIRIEGNVTEECNLSVYLNDNDYVVAETTTEPTTDPGRWSFSVDISLSRDVEFDAESSSPDHNWSGLFQSASAWQNDIKLVCEDRVGNKAEHEAEIIYSLCSVGSWWEVETTEPMPSILTPRLIIQGMAQIGIGINLTWQASTVYNGTVTDVRLVPLAVPQDEIDDWDLGWVSGMPLVSSRNKTESFANIRLKAIDPSRGQNWTWIEKEQNISAHRRDNCTTIGGFGCVRLPLVLEIDFQTDNPADRGATFTQKECWVPVEVAIDERLDPDILPESFLKKAVRFLDKFIETVDRVLKPLKKIEKWTVYACLISWAVLFAKAWRKRGVCEIASAVGFATSGSTFELHIPKYGDEACYYQYNAKSTSECGDDNEKCDNCVECAGAETNYAEFEQKMQWICDRVFCPTAPTFRAYVEDSSAVELGRPSPREATSLDGEGMSNWDKDQILGYSSEISDCDLAKAKGESGAYYYGSQKVDSALKDWEDRSKGDVDCTKPHIPNAKCCSTEYMNEYDSVCGLPTAKMFNELKESACLEAQERKDQQMMNDMQCSTTWNSVAGFCDPDGHEPADYVPSSIYTTKDSRNTDTIFIKMVDPDSPVGLGDKWLIEAGTVKSKPKDVNDDATGTGEKHMEGKENLIQSRNYFIPLGTGNMESYFIDPSTKKVKDLDEACGSSPSACNFCNKLQPHVEPDSTIKLHALCKDVHGKIGSGRTEIVDPTSGLLRSAQCLCLPALKSYLSFYRDMAVAVKACFNTILTTGDGDSGMCQAVLTVYICDLIWDMIRCFKQKFTYVPGREKGGGFGSIVSRISGASDDMSNSVSKRYGDTAPWKAMFAEKKIVHALCLWAFTGTWDLDITSFFESNYSIPIESQGMLYPCERRFQGFDPSSSPSGRPTYVYHIGAGLVAGANLTNVHLDLQCTNGICNAADGYENSLCDCREGTETINSGWSEIDPNMDPGNVLSEDVYVQHTGYRYDQAVLYWTYTNNQGDTLTKTANCSIRKVGPDDPAFCSWSFVHGAYLCDFGGDDDCLGYFRETPRVVSGNNYVGQELKFETPLAHGGGASTSVNNQCTKFIKIEVKNADTHRTVYTSDYLKPLNFNGTMDLELVAGTIQKDWFGSSSGVHMTSKDNNNVVTKAMTSTRPGNFKITLNEGSPTCYTYPSDDTTCTNANPSVSAGRYQGSVVECAGNLYVVDLSLTGKTSECLVLTQETSSSDQGCDTTNPNKRFTAEITMYDAEEYGSTWRANTNSISTYDGETQQKTINFELFCDANSASSAGAATDGPQSTLLIAGRSDATQLDQSESISVEVSINPNGKPLEGVSIYRKFSGADKQLVMSSADGDMGCGESCASTSVNFRGYNNDWTPGEYWAEVFYYNTGNVPARSRNAVTITARGAGSGSSSSALTVSNPDSTNTIYCKTPASWGNGAACGAAEYWLRYSKGGSTIKIECVKSGNEKLGEVTYSDGSKTPDWGKTMTSCERKGAIGSAFAVVE